MYLDLGSPYLKTTVNFSEITDSFQRTSGNPLIATLKHIKHASS